MKWYNVNELLPGHCSENVLVMYIIDSIINKHNYSIAAYIDGAWHNAEDDEPFETCGKVITHWCVIESP